LLYLRSTKLDRCSFLLSRVRKKKLKLDVIVQNPR